MVNMPEEELQLRDEETTGGELLLYTCKTAQHIADEVIQNYFSCRGPLVAFVAGGIFGTAVGVAIGNHRAKGAYAKEKSELVKYIKLQDDSIKAIDKQWSAEYAKVFNAYQELDKETVERDYEEFKAPDTNNDDMISRTEFNTYVRKYLSSFPELSEKDFPKFEEFDLDGDGMVSFDEWQQFLQLQKQMEAKKAKSEAATSTGGKGNTNSAYNDLLAALYEQSDSASDFKSLNKNMDSKKSQRKLPKAGAY